MDIVVFMTFFFLLQGICFYVSKKVSKNLNTQEEYFLAGRAIKFFPLMMTLIATQIGGGLILGSCEEAYRYGWIVFLYPLGQSLGFLLLALGVGKRLSRFNVSTIAELFEVVYRSPFLKKVASIFSIVSIFMIFVAQIMASKKFMITLGVDETWIFVALWVIVICYTAIGGFKAVVATDIIQATFFIVVFLACFAYGFFAKDFTFASLFSQKETVPFEFNQSKFLGWLLMPLLFTVIEQDMGQRCFAAKSAKVVSIASGFAALCTMSVALIPIFYGMLGKIKGIEAAPGGSIFMEVVSLLTNPFMTALVGCAILAAIISTADSLLNAICSNLSQDFKIGRGNLFSAKAATIVIGLVGLSLSFMFNGVVDLLIFSYELSVSALFVPIFAALFIRSSTPLTAFLSVSFGLMSFLIFRFSPLPFFPKEIASLLFSLIGYGAGLVFSLSKGKAVSDLNRL